MNGKIDGIEIISVVTSLPDNVISFIDDVTRLKLSDKNASRIQKTIGLGKRFVCDEQTTALDLCEHAANKLLENFPQIKNKLGIIVFVTQTPDHFQPSNSNLIHGKLNLPETCAALDINLGCSGFTYGLTTISSLLSSSSSEYALLLTGDTLSKCTSPRDTATSILFGDAGSATLIRKCNKKKTIFFNLMADGKGAHHISMPAGGFRTPKSAKTQKFYEHSDRNFLTNEHLHMNGGEVFSFSISKPPQSFEDLINFHSIEQDEIDYFIFHQANKFIINNISRKLNLEKDKVPDSIVENFGNLSSASIPASINHIFGSHELNPYHSLGKKVIFSGFGVGLSWGTIYAELNLNYCPPVQTFYRN